MQVPFSTCIWTLAGNLALTWVKIHENWSTLVSDNWPFQVFATRSRLYPDLLSGVLSLNTAGSLGTRPLFCPFLFKFWIRLCGRPAEWMMTRRRREISCLLSRLAVETWCVQSSMELSTRRRLFDRSTRPPATFPCRHKNGDERNRIKYRVERKHQLYDHLYST